MLTAIIDYESGNLHSAEKAFQRMAREMDAGEVVVTSDAEVVARADRLVLPGDGAFPACAAELRGHKGIYEAMVEAVEQKARPFLGICVGMQLMATTGHEYEETPGLGWVQGDVVKITPNDPSLKVPHMGWNNLVIDHDHPVFDGIQSGDHTYFVHSYHFRVTNPAERLAHVDYAGDVTAVIGRDTMLGMQFHPEKSQDIGLRMIGNFLTWKP
ncbi:Imidazole glycerol phosphate synthase subunit HisH 1 [Tritonibacter multivorans]|uniref:Imidazole glycerol phosphate synthase subunit HisH n=1 Tax=Tritonibacter multivorans TaxID=928856 RepID=A0A0P1GFF8_9RHOB|nr:imidazole glycerol phosphate synthase subunit HisH [Tritonibacter multivorans]MDA7421074.1 imidazole glycerol phosphate synthase subunit HisH [Tritonibacter multivorans]CUH80230.1 Imidazole glycerol phosphate synthase subunit HisH 1 [Tritonibacter multivorans]SFC76187.1 glutamine amidotransferase [Tritonibacter multivorans]